MQKTTVRLRVLRAPGRRADEPPSAAGRVFLSRLQPHHLPDREPVPTAAPQRHLEAETLLPHQLLGVCVIR